MDIAKESLNLVKTTLSCEADIATDYEACDGFSGLLTGGAGAAYDSIARKDAENTFKVCFRRSAPTSATNLTCQILFVNSRNIDISKCEACSPCDKVTFIGYCSVDRYVDKVEYPTEERVKKLQAYKADSASKLATKQAEISKLTKDLADLPSKVKTQNESLTKLGVKLSTLKSSLEKSSSPQLRALKQQLTDQVRALQLQFDDEQAKLKAMSAEKLQLDLSKFQTEAANLERRYKTDSALTEKAESLYEEGKKQTVTQYEIKNSCKVQCVVQFWKEGKVILTKYYVPFVLRDSFKDTSEKADLPFDKRASSDDVLMKEKLDFFGPGFNVYAQRHANFLKVLCRAIPEQFHKMAIAAAPVPNFESDTASLKPKELESVSEAKFTRFVD